MKLDEIKASYTGDKRNAGKKDPWAHFVLRPLSFYVAYPLINRGISANQVTFASLTSGLIGCAFLSLGFYWAVVIGAGIINIYALLDYVDGDIARATKTVTKYGAAIDGTSYMIVTSLLFIVIRIGLHNPLYLILGFTASLIRILRYAITFQAKLSSTNNLSRVYILGVMAITSRDPVLFVCAIAGLLPVFLIFYVFANACELGAILVLLFRSQKNDRLGDKIEPFH